MRLNVAQDSRPTICQVLHSLDIGGAEVLAAGLAQSLSDQFRFVFACLDGVGLLGEQLREDGFTVEVMDRQPGIDWKCGFRLAKFLRENNVGAIHAHQYTPFFQSLLARLAYRKPPVIFTEHGRHYPDSRSSKRVAVNRVLTRGDDRIIGVGDSVSVALVENEGFRRGRVETVYNGVELGPFEAVCGDVELRSRVRRELQVSDHEKVILQVARLNPLKDHLTALKAVDSLRASGVDVRLILAGEGEERRRIEQFVVEHTLEKHVTLLGARRDIPRLLAAADAFLLSSVSEGIPLTLIEAMAAGVPVVCTDVGGVAEVIQNGGCGLLAEAQDSEGLANHVRSMLDQSGMRDRIVGAAHARAREFFSLTRMHRDYLAIYEQALGLDQTGASDRTVASEKVLESVG